jgi:outer membrane PBP1 activator LpoA protein
MNDRLRRCLLAALALVLVSTLPALSAAQTTAASDASAAPAATDKPPTAGGAGTATVPPSSTLPPPAAAAVASPMRRTARIALVLPLGSATYGSAAEAVKDGFAAAAGAAGASFELIAHGDGDVLSAIDAARDSGARVIVGPLVRDDVRAVAGISGDLPRVIALNQLDDGTPLPPWMYALTLGIDGEARQLVQRARQDGAQTVAIIGSDSALQKRFADAFVGEWILAGGGPPMTYRLDRAPELLAALRREIARAAPGAILLAVDARDAALVKPYLGPVATFTSSQVNDQLAPGEMLDLDGVMFVEIPWLADPAAPAFNGIPRREYPSAAFSRLYALGLDAMRVARAFAGDTPPQRLEFDGATGHLTLEPSRQFVRAATLLQFRDGEIVPAGVR